MSCKESVIVFAFPLPGLIMRTSRVEGVHAIRRTARSTSSPTRATGLKADLSMAVLTMRRSASYSDWCVEMSFSCILDISKSGRGKAKTTLLFLGLCTHQEITVKHHGVILRGIILSNISDISITNGAYRCVSLCQTTLCRRKPPSTTIACSDCVTVFSVGSNNV
uniref:Uncharacterized protein n=1 Tax=Cacopsylla melanoneura TaxID=428564 RepID=A0A8D8UP73_9HEMI